ncbi:reverse transcriptase family protein [Luteolibacter sp. Populi]|uniref:reverse transcriptase family protein n=1 Tax=Luteolibacter sp. Populi TaxID=3230487 RepID=UPI003465B5F2
MPSRAHHIRRLATAFAAGPMDDPVVLMERAGPLVGPLSKARWLAPLAKALCVEFAGAPRPVLWEIGERIGNHEPYAKAWSAGRGRIAIAMTEPQMAPAAGAPRTWNLPEIPTMGELCEVLGLHADDLGWLIARGQAEHYIHRWHAKPKSGRFRLIESPKALLKHAQRGVLRKILHPIPPHEGARGFRERCSVRDFVEPHTGKELVVRFDLEDFFPSISAARVLRIFLTAGYPETVAQALTRLTTHATPHAVLEGQPLAWAERRRLATPHLPQGAPTSPALANLAAFHLDCRLSRLAKACGAEYTRYADDLLFSGGEEFARRSRRFEATVGAILIEEAFHPNHHKTRILRQGQKQHAAGLVLNEKPNIDRGEFDRLKAILTNCARLGPASQNRDGHADFAAHLQGKLAWVRFINPGKAAKLHAIYERVDWERAE